MPGAKLMHKICCLVVLLLIALAARCNASSPIASADKHRFVPGSLVKGYASDLTSVQGHAVIKISEVLFGDASLKGQTFIVQTSNDKSYGRGVVSPVLKPGENAVWGVWEGYHSDLGSDGLKHYTHMVDWDYDSFAAAWPIRESDKTAYDEAPAMAAVLMRLEASKDWTDFNKTLSQLRAEEKDPYLANWEKRLWVSYQGIVN